MALNVGELFASFSIDTSGVETSMNEITQQCNSIASDLKTTGAVMSAGLTTPVVAFGKAMYNAGTDFEAQMSKVQALAGLRSDVEQDAAAIEALTAKALYMGSTTEWTATQAGQALEYMAMAGWKSDAMLAGLPAVMHLATAAGSQLGTVSDIVTDAMTAFGLTISSVNGDTQEFNKLTVHFADIIAAAATNSNTNVQLLGTSFKYVAPLAGTLGMRADEVAVALGLMANSGIKSTMSGAALRNILSGLLGSTKKTADACSYLDVSLMNADGSSKSMLEVMTMLRQKYAQNKDQIDGYAEQLAQLDAQLADGTISQELYERQIESLTKQSSMFMTALVDLGGKQGLSGLLAIMSASDEDFNNLLEALMNCDGAAQQMAATMLNNAKGAVTIFNSAVEGLQITLWNLLSEDFVGIVNGARGIVQSFTSLDSKTQKTILKMAGIAAAAGPIMIAVGGLVGSLPSIVSSLSAMISPLGIVGGSLALFGVAAFDADNNIGKLLQSLSVDAKSNLQTFNASVRTTISDVSSRIPELTKSIVTSLNNVMPQAMKSITQVVLGLVDMVSENADDVATIGVTILTNIIDGLADAMPKLIPAAANMIANLGSAIIDNLPLLMQSVNRLASSVSEGIGNINWLQIGMKLFTSASGAGQQGKNLLASFFGSSVVGESGLFGSNGILGKLLPTKEKAAAETTSVFSPVLESVGTVIVNGLVAAIDSMSDVSVQLVTAIGGLFSRIDWNAVGVDLSALGTAIINGIVTSLGAVVDGATNIANAIVELISSVDWATLTQATVSLAGTLLGGILGGFQTLTPDLTQLISAISRGVVAASEGLGQVAGTLIGKLVVALVTPQNWLKLIQVGGTLVEGIATGIISLGQGILSGAWQFVASTFVAFTDALGITDAKTRQALSHTVQTVNAAGQQMEVSIGTAWSNITNLGLMGSRIFDQNSLKNIIDSYNAVITFGTEQMIEKIGQYSFFADDTVSQLFNMLINTANSESDRVAAALALKKLGMWDYIDFEYMDGGQQVYAAANNLAQKSAEQIVTAFQQIGLIIPQQIKNSLADGTYDLQAAVLAMIEATSAAKVQETAQNGAATVGSAVPEQIAASATEGVDKVTAASEQLVTAQQIALSTLPDIAKITGEEATIGMAEGVSNGQQTVTNAMDALSTQTVYAAVYQMNFQTGFNIGQMFTDGIAQGIQAGIGKIVRAAQAVASAAVTSSKEQLQIRSPSRIARDQVGMMYDLGIVQGLLQGRSQINEAAKIVSSDMHDQFYVGDPSRNTVSSSSESAYRTAKQLANASRQDDGQNQSIASAITKALAESGLLDRVIVMDKKVVGQQVAGTVSKTISSSSKMSVKGRSSQGVLT